MSREVVILPAKLDFATAARILLDNHFNGAPVVDD
jgi:CBS domain-containing protein